MTSIQQMQAAINSLPKTEPVTGPVQVAETSTVRDVAVNVLGSAIPAVKHGLNVTTESTSKFGSDVATVYRFKELVRKGVLNADGTPVVPIVIEVKNVRPRAR